MATIAASPDSYHVQVGGDDDDEDDTYSDPKIDVKTNLLVDALSEGTANPTVRSTITAKGSFSGGGEPSDTPPTAAAAAAAATVVAAKRGASPAAAAVADCAVARSVLDMGGTPLQSKGKEWREDRGFELSVIAGSPVNGGGRGGGDAGGLYLFRGGGGAGGRGGCGNDGAGNSSDDGAAGVDGPADGGDGGDCGGGLRYFAGERGEREKCLGGMNALTRLGGRETDKKKGRESMDVVESERVGHVQEERAGDGNGGLVASGESKAGGLCLTPATRANATNDLAWKANKMPGGGDVGPAAASAAERGSATAAAAAAAEAGGSTRRGNDGGTCGGEENNTVAAAAAGTYFVI